MSTTENLGKKAIDPTKVFFYIPGSGFKQNRANKGSFLIDGKDKKFLTFDKETPEQTLHMTALILASGYTEESVLGGLNYLKCQLSDDWIASESKLKSTLTDFMEEIDCKKSMNFLSRGQLNSSSEEYGYMGLKCPASAKEVYPVHALWFCVCYFDYDLVKSAISEAYSKVV